MIHEVDEGLRRLLGESGLEASGVEVVFDAPTRDWAARRSAPTVCVFLY
ncbi:Pvc16 family protein, partial [Streptomyces sp. NPDC002343]